MTTAPRVEACIDAVMAKYPRTGPVSQAKYYEEVHQHLGPLARDLERELAAAQARSEWIPVTDRLPDFDVPVAVAWNKAPWRTDCAPAVDDMLHARNDDADGWLWYTVATGDLDEWDLTDMPTHWMPLPSPPA